MFPATAAPQDLTRLDRLELVSAVWAEARYHYPFWDRVRANWDSAYRATLAAAERPSPPAEFHRSLRELIALLHSGEADVLPSRRVGQVLGRAPLHLIEVESKPVVARMVRTAEMRMAGLEVGSVILEVQGIPVERWLRDSVLPATGAATDAARSARAIEDMLVGARGTAVHLAVRGPDGARRGMSVTRSMPWDEPSPVPWWRDDLLIARDTGTTRLLALASLDDPAVVGEFDRAMRRNPAPEALLIDLRGTVGGGHAQALELIRRLIGSPVAAPRTKHRLYWPLRRAGAAAQTGWTWHLSPPDTITPSTDPPPFGGRVVLVTSARTAGAAEVLARTLQLGGRATIVGETTAGATGPAAALPVAAGFTFVIAVGGVVDPDATDVSGSGVVPDVAARPTLEAVLAGRDAVLERALEAVGGRER